MDLKPISQTTIGQYLRKMTEADASDIFISVGIPVKMKTLSVFTDLTNTPMTNDDIRRMLMEIVSEDQLREFEAVLEMNLALSDEEGERFRVNVYFQQRNLALVIRHIKAAIPTLEALGLPDIYKKFVMEKRGLFLMTGSTGSGKSTSVASMLEYRNQQISGHIVTVEDPIEYVFRNKKSIFSQREVGIDTYSFAIALKNALRQAPDVLFIGELRDREAIENAILFAETGHLVVGTIHSNNTNQTFERILSMFPKDLHNKIMISLSHTLNALAGQRLVKGIDGKMKLVFEVLINEGLITECIKEFKLTEIKDVMQKNIDIGMMTYDECLFQMVRKGIIDKDLAIKEADNAHNLRLKLSQYSSSNISPSAVAAATAKNTFKDNF